MTVLPSVGLDQAMRSEFMTSARCLAFAALRWLPWGPDAPLPSSAQQDQDSASAGPTRWRAASPVPICSSTPAPPGGAGLAPAP